MTVAGGIGHTVPYLITSFYTATAVAAVVVAIELQLIAYIRWRLLDTPPVSEAAKVMLGGDCFSNRHPHRKQLRASLIDFDAGRGHPAPAEKKSLIVILDEYRGRRPLPELAGVQLIIIVT
jgi:hypothetical protein